MEFNFLPQNIRQAILNLNIELLYEIRLRDGYPIKINYSNNVCYLSDEGTTSDHNKAIYCSLSDINYIINCATEKSIYAFNDRIKDGFLTVENGVRIGICGECVYSNQKISTIKNFSSLNIRIPHEIYNCSDSIFDYVFSNNKINNTLIVSPPFLGKTTLLKDIAMKLNVLNNYSILIIDERGEFINVKGENIDSVKYCDKYYAFNYAVRSMSPSVIITDELSSANDWKCANEVVSSGIKIIASCHSDNIDNLTKKECFIKNIFDIYVVLSNRGFGKVNHVFDRDLVCL